MEQVLSSSKGRENQPSPANILNLSKESGFIFACTFTAFLVRFFVSRYETVIYWDGVYYAKLGGKIISGDLSGGISAYWSPLYSLLIGISSIFFRDLEYSGKFVSVIAGTLLIVPSYFLIRDFYGRIPAFIGTILIVIHPGLVNSSSWVLTESLYTLVFTTGVLVTWCALRDGEARNFFFTGLLFGTAYLIKPEAVGFIGLVLVLMFGAEFFGRFRLRFLLKHYSVLLLGFLIFFLPYVVFLHQKTGHFTISQKLINNFPVQDNGSQGLKLNADGQYTMTDRLFGDIYQTESRPTIVSSPADSSAIDSSSVSRKASGLFSKALSNLKKQLKQYILELFPFSFLFVLLMIIGFFFQPWTRLRTAKEIYLLSFFICTLAGYALTVIQVRYLYPLIPILIAWIAYSITQFSYWATNTISNFLPDNRKVNPILIQISASLFIAAIFIFSLAREMGYKVSENHPFEEKQAGLWIKDHKNSPSLIMAQSPIVGFYAGADHIYLPNEEPSKIVEYAKRMKANYLVLCEKRLKDTPKAFSGVEPDFPPELKLVYKDERISQSKIFVYQILN